MLTYWRLTYHWPACQYVGMTSRELAAILQDELQKRSWTVTTLAKEAQMNRETVRRAVHGIGSTALDNANILLAIVGRKLAEEVPA